jgi:type IV pilus assembly protein PilB
MHQILNKRRKIGEILVDRGALSLSDLSHILGESDTAEERIGSICLRRSLVTEEDLAQALAEQFGMEYVDIKGFKMDEGVLDMFPTDALCRHQFVPMEARGDSLAVAIADPTDVITMDELEFIVGRTLDFRITTESALKSVLGKGDTTSRMLKGVSDDFTLQLVRETEKGEEILSVETISDDTSPIVKLVNSTILDALNKRASDIHIETTQEGVFIKYRIDGVLYQAMEPVDQHFQAPLISRLKVMSELDISERRIPQDGRFKVRLSDKSIDFRISIMPSAHGEDAVIRILDKGSIAADIKQLSMEALGMNALEIRRIRKAIREPYGMFLVTGPTGSGKSTTLYAALTEIHTGEEKIITIEDPVEYLLQGIVQIPVNEKKGLTFARGLRSILRHDPDKIMVGEIRDPETAQIAVQSALTGHLVFTTVHANNIFDVIGRFIHMGIDPYNFVSCLNSVLAQRLIRRLCPKCKVPVKYDAETLLESNIDPDLHAGSDFYEARGCAECNDTGYRGRAGIVEFLDLTDEIREMIIGKVPIAQLKKAAGDAGTVFLRESALEKVLAGETTLREINRVTFVD